MPVIRELRISSIMRERPGPSSILWKGGEKRGEIHRPARSSKEGKSTPRSKPVGGIGYLLEEKRMKVVEHIGEETPLV